MTIVGWDSKYKKILKDFGYSRRKDSQSCKLLDSLLPKKISTVKIRDLIENKPVFVVGAGPSLPSCISILKKYKKINIGNLKTNISNKKVNQSVNGNTNTVYINPLNSLRFVLNKVKKDKVNLDKDFYVFTGSTVGVVPIQSKGLYTGKIDKLGSVKAIIY